MLETMAGVEKAYWDLVSARQQVTIRRNSVVLAEQQRDDTQVRVQARTIPASDIAQPIAEVERRRGVVFEAQEQVARAEQALKLLILDEGADSWWGTELDPVGSTELPDVTPDLALALADAAQYRPELTEGRADVMSHDVRISLARDSLKPRVDLVASYVTRGLAGDHNADVMPFVPGLGTTPDSLNGGIGSSLNGVVHNRFPDAMVGVTVDIPLGHRSARGQLGAAEADRRQSVTALEQTRQRIATDVRNALTSLETAIGRIQAAQA
jgi:HAE1 family hydrophobic/amphiphilic exporter-1